MSCKFASSGCNSPEGECMELCMIVAFAVHPEFENCGKCEMPRSCKGVRSCAKKHSSTKRRKDQEMSQLTIEYDGIHFEVEYEYSPAQDSVFDLESPSVGLGYDSSVEIFSAKVGGVDMIEMLSKGTISAIERKLIQQIED